MTTEEKIKCNVIIHSASAAAATVGAGLAQLPGSDSAIIIPIQTGMVIGLGAVFGVELSLSTAEAMAGTAAATLVGRTSSQLLIGWIPGVGNAVNAATAATLTESMGWMIAKQFEMAA